MSAITTHVLDVAQGRPAAGIAVTLEFSEGDGFRLLGRDATDADGRARSLLPAGAPLRAGTYRLTFATGAWHRAQGVVAFWPEVSVLFEVRDPDAHHHVPLLLSPFGYSTYRGS
jgi:5-hydroxyisourate hydrolase